MSESRAVHQTIALPFEESDNGWVAGNRRISRAFIELNAGRHNARPASPGLVRSGDLPPNVFEIDLAAVGLAGARGIEFIGEEPIGVARFILEGGEGAPSAWIPSDPCPESESGFIVSPLPGTEDRFGPREHESALQGRLEREARGEGGASDEASGAPAPATDRSRPSTREVETAKAFFIDIELSTNTEAPIPPEMKALVDKLTHRMRFDAERRHRRLTLGTRRYVTEDDRPRVAVIADLFERLMLEHFPLPGASPSEPTKIDTRAVGRAFELFANGDLRWEVRPRYWATQPSSYYYLCFGELAIIVAEHAQQDGSRNAELWTRLAIEIVRTERIFVDAYAPRGERRLEDYGPRNYQESNRVGDAQIQRIRDEYADIFLDVPDDQRLEKIRELAAANLLLADPTMAADEPAR